MALTTAPNPPPEGAALVDRKVGMLFGNPPSRLAASLAADPLDGLDRLRRTEPHRAFACSLRDAAEDALSLAVFSSWRYIVLFGEAALIEADLGQVTPNDRWRVGSIAESPSLVAELDDLDWLAAQPEVKDRDFEVCYLRVPAGISHAWWLRAARQDRSDDVLLPVQPSHPELRGTAPELLSAREFRSRVATLARRRLADGEILLRGVPERRG